MAYAPVFADTQLELATFTERGAGVLTRIALPSGVLVATLGGCRRSSRPTQQTIQCGPNSHLVPGGRLAYVAYLNHSCSPNLVVDTDALEIRTAREVAAGEELTFFYPSTEWGLARPFDCRCGTARCLGAIAGAWQVTAEVLSRYVVNRFIRELHATVPSNRTQ